MLKFTIEAKLPNGRGRAGAIQTAHGVIETPAFIPVGTKATVKSLTPEQVRALGAEAVLANTYHLYLQPGTDILEKAGGLGKFMNWPGPTFTDSGGFQAFSLGAAFNKTASKIGKRGSEIESVPTGEHANFARVTEDGVEFKSVLDGSTHFFTPEKSIEIQHSIGADIIFAFDECTSPHATYTYQREAMDRTHRWAVRSLERHTELSGESALFGIVQGGRHEDLRKESARTIGNMKFDGFGIGGSFDKEDIAIAVGWVADELPEGKPRHLLGIGAPEDIILGIENGMDTFDCVTPTRIARNGAAYVKDRRTDGFTINLLNAEFKTDFAPIETGCGCYTCTNYTRAYLAHLFRAKEMLAATLTSIHNLYFLIHLAKKARKAIVEGKWEEFKKEYIG
ncbi:MAG: tRNA guanosine(34) transglycosylase Tgt [Patescibacteria group bacterium]